MTREKDTVHEVAQHPMAKLRRSLYSRLPVWIRERDFELFTLLLCFCAGLPLLFTQRAEATSLEAQVHPLVLLGWALVLAIAPLIVVFGARRSHYTAGLQSFRWIRWEVFGLRMLSYAAHLYATIIIVNSLSSKGVFQPAVTIIVIFGLTCTSRAWGLLDKIERFWERMGAGRGCRH